MHTLGSSNFPRRGWPHVATNINVSGFTVIHVICVIILSGYYPYPVVAIFSSSHLFILPSGYLVIRMTPSGRKSVIKQLKWFETRDQHILDIALDPLGEWLACACLNGSLYLLPVLSLTCKVG